MSAIRANLRTVVEASWVSAKMQHRAKIPNRADGLPISSVSGNPVRDTGDLLGLCPVRFAAGEKPISWWNYLNFPYQRARSRAPVMLDGPKPIGAGPKEDWRKATPGTQEKQFCIGGPRSTGPKS